jgi:hypothetical protein
VQHHGNEGWDLIGRLGYSCRRDDDIRRFGFGQVRNAAGPNQDGGPAADGPDQPFQMRIWVWGSGTGLGPLAVFE